MIAGRRLPSHSSKRSSDSNSSFSPNGPVLQTCLDSSGRILQPSSEYFSSFFAIANAALSTRRLRDLVTRDPRWTDGASCFAHCPDISSLILPHSPASSGTFPFTCLRFRSSARAAIDAELLLQLFLRFLEEFFVSSPTMPRRHFSTFASGFSCKERTTWISVLSEVSLPDRSRNRRASEIFPLCMACMASCFDKIDVGSVVLGRAHGIASAGDMIYSARYRSSLDRTCKACSQLEAVLALNCIGIQGGKTLLKAFLCRREFPVRRNEAASSQLYFFSMLYSFSVNPVPKHPIPSFSSCGKDTTFRPKRSTIVQSVVCTESLSWQRAFATIGSSKKAGRV
mmetsp:Transcript_17099/g.24245  ORF Transcript_17099/g.24245 Transcript_17099/m.24245 type:complete len:340 (+) Transcript_17099:3436-4455(+)